LRVHSEYSAWSRNTEIAVLQACRETGAALVAFSPVGRAALTGTLHDVTALDAKDIRRGMPRFAPAAYAANLGLLAGYNALAAEAGCTPAQLALAWLLARGEHVVPIPGTTQSAHLHENLGATAFSLAPALVAKVDALMQPQAPVGGRYSAASQSEVDTEEFNAPA
jgi:hypothetical protein